MEIKFFNLFILNYYLNQVARSMQKIKIGSMKHFEFYDVLSLIDFLEFQKDQDNQCSINQDISRITLQSTMRIIQVPNRWLKLYLK